MDTGPFWIDYLAGWSTAGAALVTAITAVFIAIQIWQTGRSVKSTEEALVLAREEQWINRAAVVDAQKARIDAEMPRLTVVVGSPVGEVHDSTVDRFAINETNGARLSAFAPGHPDSQFVLPRDALRALRVTAAIVITNDGPRRAIVTISQPNSGQIEPTVSIVEVDKSVYIELDRVHTLREWTEYAKIHTDGVSSSLRTSDFILGTVTYTYPGEVGAIEEHQIMQKGAMLTRVDGTDSDWQISEFRKGYLYPTIRTEVMPFTRTYYASIRERRHLW